MSQELWIWAKAQVLSSLRTPYALETVLPALKKASAGAEDLARNQMPTPSQPPAQLLPPSKANNPVKASRTHQDLHKELLLTHRKGLGLHSKPELLRVLEKRRCQGREGEEPAQDLTPLQLELQRRQQRREEKQQKEAREEKGSGHEFLKVRENLRKSPWRDPTTTRPSTS
ncbi:actin-associated protein FAM107A-like isoform X2 [Ambystoma mexicanum]|uniref:actin-associated protein FAM107A-like isoform X2 n=1 Tax=Ambystoma mexicanum TaxID=8296 RepID=UPI0037E70F12